MAKRKSSLKGTYIFSGGKGASQQQIKDLKQYVDDSILGTTGPLAGKPCTINSITNIEGGKRVTFGWYDNSGSSHTSTMDVMDGAEVTQIEINAEDHIIFTFSDGRTVDGGEVPIADDADEVAYTNEGFPSITNVKEGLDTALLAGAKLQNPITVSNAVGSATSGKTYAAGTPLETIIKDMLIKEVAPGLTLTITPSTVLYDVVTDSVSQITMKAAVTKNTYPLSKVEFYLGTTLKNTENISASGTYQYNMTWATPTKSNFTLKAIAYDTRTETPMSTSKEIQVKFIGKSYYGTVDSTVGDITESIIKALQNKTLKDTKNLTYSGITMTYGKVVYAYPAELGNLTSIMDEVNNISYTNSFTKSTVSVDGISYNVYTQTDPSASTDVELKFR